MAVFWSPIKTLQEYKSGSLSGIPQGGPGIGQGGSQKEGPGTWVFSKNQRAWQWVPKIPGLGAPRGQPSQKNFGDQHDWPSGSIWKSGEQQDNNNAPPMVGPWAGTPGPIVSWPNEAQVWRANEAQSWRPIEPQQTLPPMAMQQPSQVQPRPPVQMAFPTWSNPVSMTSAVWYNTQPQELPQIIGSAQTFPPILSSSLLVYSTATEAEQPIKIQPTSDKKNPVNEPISKLQNTTTITTTTTPRNTTSATTSSTTTTTSSKTSSTTSISDVSSTLGKISIVGILSIIFLL